MSQITPTQSRVDLAALREKLAQTGGAKYWRSLEELAATPEFQAFLEDEFPSRADALTDPQSRRDMLRVMGAMFAMAGLTGCVRQPQERILPYVRQPEEVIPGRPLFFATSMPFRGLAVGLLAESHEGRPTKIEGNALHPASLGRTLPFHQASTLDLYDPDRSQTVMHRGRISGWGQFLTAMAELRQSIGDGTGLHFLSDVNSSPTLAAQRQAMLSRYPAMQWHEYDPVGQDSGRHGARAAFGAPVTPLYHFDRANVILSLDADFLFSMPGSIPYAGQFISRRRAGIDRKMMNRLYVVEPSPTNTGDRADHRFPVKASDVERFGRAVAARIGIGSAGDVPAEWNRAVQAIAADLQANRGSSLVVPGEQQTPAVHALAHAMNGALGNAGTTVVYADADGEPIDQTASMRALMDAMRAGQVRALMIFSANPVYDTPADLEFLKAFEKVPLRVHLGTHYDETGVRSHWHIPQAHYLESWGDAVAYDGTASIIQPLIQPLYDGKTVHQMLATLTDSPEQSSYDIVREFWRSQAGDAGFDDRWAQWLHDGLIPNTAYPTRSASVAANAVSAPASAQRSEGLEIVFRPDPTIWDGRFANNGWLQECPKPHTKLTWDNAVLVSPATAQRLGLNSDDEVEVRYRGRSVRGPVWITQGQVNDSITLYLGYGRTRAGRVGNETGFNAYALRTSDAPYFGSGAELRKTGGKWKLACTQNHHSMQGRDIVRFGSNQEFLKNPEMFATPEKEEAQYKFSLYPEWQYKGHAWGMAIDQNACIECNACVVACQAENNIPVVGKEQVLKSREMLWLRIDRYFSGNIDNPRAHHQPMLCQHCEKAPCEPVCPVAATVHSGEGLNQMVYNRCIGTRYCSNNCPYKVRRFNFLLFSDWHTPSLEPLRNPDVTVRSRGVMEKCTFCVQRIQEVKIDAEKQNRPIRDGEIVTACQAACPTEAIIFGDLNDKKSRVKQLHGNPMAYGLLTELATQPRVKYLAEVWNPHPDLVERT